MGVGAIVAGGIGDLGPAEGAQQAEQPIAPRRERLRGLADTHLPGILAPGGVAHAMDAVLNRPMPPPQGFDLGGRGGTRRQAGHPRAPQP